MSDRFFDAQFRLQRLREDMLDLEEYALGTDTPVLPFTVDEQGHFSSERMEKLLDSLLEGLYPWDPDRERMREFYRCLFYCSIRACTTTFTRFYPGGSEAVGEDPSGFTFHDLLVQLRPSPQFPEPGDEEDYDLHMAPVHPRLYMVMGELYTALTGNRLYSPVMRGTGTYGPDYLYDRILEDALGEEEETEAEDYEMDPEEEEESNREYEEEMERQKRAADEGAKEEGKRLRGCFPCPEDYVYRYEKLVEMFPDCYRRYSFEYDVKDMVAWTLMRQGKSRLEETDPCLTMRAYLSRALRSTGGGRKR